MTVTRTRLLIKFTHTLHVWAEFNIVSCLSVSEIRNVTTSNSFGCAELKGYECLTLQGRDVSVLYKYPVRTAQ